MSMNIDCDCDICITHHRDRCDRDERFHRIWVKKLEACKAWIKEAWIKELTVRESLCANDISTPKICAGTAIVDQVDANNACITNLNAENQCVQNITATSASVVSLTANDVCVPGTLRVGNFLNCGVYRADVVYSVPTTYTLGDFIDFDAILDDPNGNVTLTPTTYTVPVAGYYNVSLQFNTQNLIPAAGFGPILGLPVANPQIYVNGVIYSESLTTFLSFNPQQKSTLTTMLLLSAGDIVQVKYNVLTIDATSGVIFVPGTVDSFGDGSDINTSSFKIHILSVSCNELPVPCAPVIACDPCTPQQCTPCDANPCDDDNDDDCSSGMCNKPGMGMQQQSKPQPIRPGNPIKR